MTNHKKIIGILGGMGPEAGCIMHRYINQAAKEILKTARDDDYPDIIHMSMPQEIPDRTDFLLGLTEENPGLALGDIAILLAGMAETINKSIVACVSCDTFHANPIWHAFSAKIERYDNLQMVHMVDETVQHIHASFAPPAKLALLSTIGTHKEKIYESRLLPLGYDFINLTQKQQHDIHLAIYHPKLGIKANSAKTEFSCNHISDVVQSLKEQGVHKIILGCTELSIVVDYESDAVFIDPMSIAAKKLVRLSME